MKLNRSGRLGGVALVGALALTACGSDNNSTTAGGGASSSSSSASGGSSCGTGTLQGEGSTAQKNAIEEAISSYGDTCPDVTVNYNATGSGAGIKQFTAGQVTFAGSDSALKTPPAGDEQAAADKTCGSPAWNLPMVTGPIAVSYDLPGSPALTLTPTLIGQIFNGKIASWDDPAIKAANPGVSLPSTAVKPFFRSDESGTTENFTKYLAAAAPKVWTAAPAKAWSGKGEGREKSAGVASAVKSTPGGITYVEWSYARDNKLSIAKIDNGGGAVQLSAQSVGKAVEAAKPAGSGNNLKLKLDYTTRTPGAYPVLLVTYEIVCSKAKDPAKGRLVKSFLTHFSSSSVQQGLENLGYAPLPETVRTKVATAVAALG